MKSRTALTGIAYALAVLATATAQVTPTIITDQNRTGDLPFSSTIGTDIEHVDLSSGNLSVNIPMLNLPGRGLPFNFIFRYNANLWQVASYVDTGGTTRYLWDYEARPFVNQALGWEIPNNHLAFSNNKILCYGRDHDTYSDHYIFEDLTGAKHLFAAQDAHNAPCTGTDPQGPSLDGQGLWINIPTVYTADGTQLQSLAETDRNGNQETVGVTGVDTLGRTVVTTQTGTNQYTYKIHDSTGTLQSYVVNLTTLPLLTNFGYSNIQEYDLSNFVISSIVLPNGQQYTFEYEPDYGYLTEIDLPAGGVINYTWQNIGSFVPTTPLRPQRVIQTRTVHVNGQTYLWTFAYGSTVGNVTVTDPLNNQSTYTSQYGSVYSAAFYNGVATGNPVRQYTMAYVNDACPYKGVIGPPRSGGCGDALVANRLASIVTTLDDGRVNKKSFAYDSLTYTYHTNPGFPTSPSTYTTSRGNVTESQEYDYGSAPSSYGTGSPGALLRRIDKTYLNDPVSNPSGYQNYLSRNIVDRVLQDTTYDNAANTCQGASQPCAQTQYEYDIYVAGVNALISTSSTAPQHDYTNYPFTFTYRGNVTRVKHWRNTDGALLATVYTYDDLGNIRATKDPLGNTTNYDYSDSWSGSSCLPPSNSQAYVTTVTNPLSQLIKTKYFPCTALLENQKDQNDINAGGVGTTYQYDLLNRLTLKSVADGGQVTNTYHDVPPVSVTTKAAITSSLNLTSVAIGDGLGRTTQTQLTSDPDGTTYVDTTYDALGRKGTVSNPHRSSSSPTDGTTTYGYDPLSRVKSVLEPDGSQVLTNYVSNCTTVTDEAGKGRKSCVDGIGRVTGVWEDPNGLDYESDYQYDALGDLLTVNQKGGSADPANWRTRTFTYNSLAQLLAANNPESGTLSYAYDSDGNLQSKTGPLPNQTGTSTVSTNYTYDVLNRLTGKSYAGISTLPAKFGYDGVALTGCSTAPPSLTDTNPVGTRTAMCDGSGATAWSHDLMGRLLAEKRTIVGASAITNTTTYTYAPNLDGSLNTLTYPSGRIITYGTPSGAGRTLSAVESAHSLNYVTAATYAPQGAVSGFSNGASITGIQTYNSRLQPLQLYYTNGTVPAVGQLQTMTCPTTAATIMSRSYNFGAGTNDNGNVGSITDCLNTNRTQHFDYDNLNRLKDAYTTGTTAAIGFFGEDYTIDSWNNLTNIALHSGQHNSETLNVAPATTKNQLNGFCYDAAGNLQQNTSPCPTPTYTYDAENRLSATAGATYVYDGDGERVVKCTGTYPACSAGTLYWKGTGSNTLDETSWTGTQTEEYIFFNGKRVARRDGTGNTVLYYFSDHLGSADVITGSGGGINKASAYFPYGGEIPETGSGFANNYKFTGKERDSESGLDDFEARYYASSLGRFMQPDPLFATPLHVVNPQRWNMYAYVVNNPTNYIDPDGKDAIAVNFVNEVPLGGHEGIIVVHADGSATYARFGPEHASSTVDAGKVTVQALSPVQFQGNGLPTASSYKGLSEEVAKIEGQPASTVGFNYFKTSEADSIALDNWMQGWKTHQAPDYNVTNQNCATFCILGLIQGHAIENKNISIIPNRLFMLLAGRATENWTWQGRSPKEKVTHKVCWADDKGKQSCQ